MRSSFWVDDGSVNVTSTSSSQTRIPQAVPSHPNSRHSGSNVYRLLARREVAPRTKHSLKRLWGDASKWHHNSIGPRCEAARNARCGLISWVEAESLRHLSAKYCPLLPPPSCLKVLSGHRRTPWVTVPLLQLLSMPRGASCCSFRHKVNDLDSSDSSMTLATSPGYLRYPPPTVYLADAHSKMMGESSLQHTDGVAGPSIAQQRVDHSTSVRLLTYSTPSGQYELLLSPMEPSSSSPMPEETGANSFLREMENSVPQPAMDAMDTTEVQPEERSNQFFPFGDPSYWELPFLQGWLIGQSQAGQRTIRPLSGSGHENPSSFGETETPAPMVSSDESGLQPVVSRIQSELATSLAAAAAAELPCTVKLRIWPHDIKDPCASLDAERCRLIIPHAVLSCVACMLPHLEADPGSQGQMHHGVTGAATSPTRHPISAHQVMYELRIYSLEEATFGLVLASRAIRAAHCLTSIQVSCFLEICEP
ncbi:hypothetical protein CK203_026029 [Vitis vinifera]|uniref:Uncharacterized protein n=1 Tax=Vitis vinifera TaxID=29760 RepID=A0A438IJA7_VITVI|nr:hypothetical protein CK203_026029 [Vitis vinifera]